MNICYYLIFLESSNWLKASVHEWKWPWAGLTEADVPLSQEKPPWTPTKETRRRRTQPGQKGNPICALTQTGTGQPAERCVSHMRSWIGHQQLLLMLEQGFSLRGSQFLSIAKQELILTGVLCNTRELEVGKSRMRGKESYRMTGWLWGREWKSRPQALKGTEPRTTSC